LKAMVVDDDRVLADLLAFTLRREGYQVVQSFDGESALKRFEVERPDIVILDVNLPGKLRKLDGFTICEKIRSQGNTPIILLTVRQEEDDIIKGLSLGADDYVLKPFSPRQLVARIQAVLRRAGMATPTIREAGELTIDPSRREARVLGSNPIALTSLETRLLEKLMINSGQVIPFEELIAHIWGPEAADRDMLRQLVRRLRTKIEPDPANPRYIETVAGLGYGLIKDRDHEQGI